MTQERLSDLEVRTLIALRGISKTMAKMPLFLNLLLLKRESAYSSLVDIMTLRLVKLCFVQCNREVECKTGPSTSKVVQVRFSSLEKNGLEVFSGSSNRTEQF